MPDYYTFQPVQMNRNIIQSLSPIQMGKTVILCENTANRIRTKYGLGNVPGWVNGVLHDLWVTAKVRSLPEVKLPIFTDEDSNTDRLNKTLLYEWGTARLELEFLLGDSQGNWASFGETAIKNSNGYRYRRHRGIDLITDNPGYLLEENFKIGCRLINIGFGDLTNKDKIDLTGCWVQEFVAVQPQPVYVTNNVYGGTGSATPTSSPTPVTPTFTLSLPSGKTSASATNSDQIILTVTGVTIGSSFTSTWYKGTTNTGVTESLTMTSGGIILLDSNKLLASGVGDYKLQISYSGNQYQTDTVPVTVSPTVTLAITATQSGDTSFFIVDGQTYEFSIQGANFTPGTASFTWYRDTNPATRSASPGSPVAITGTLTVAANGTFTLNKSSSDATFTSYYDSTNKSGLYKIRITQGNVTVDSNTVYGQNKVPSMGYSPVNASIAANANILVTVGHLSVGDLLTISWVKNNVELPTSASQHTYSENGGNSFNGFWYQFTISSSQFANSPYNGAGNYKLKVAKNGTPVQFITPNVLTISA